ncbi:MAG TPA: TlyA family RNA methyltransferase [Candidatus Limnocylindria bacterium]|nr:TlyA family RNA methyltransferase [Candidatus Limnocylindria bacterium]
MPRVRLDQLLVDRGLARSRAEAQALILAGQVELGGAPNRTLKPGQQVAGDASLSLVARPRWASRAGEKLAAALDAFEVDPAGLACLDAGASTGGFTDVLLARGARIVYAVDVGRGQLLDRLRRDPRVVSMERTNLRTLVSLPEPVDLATLDLSFIGLALVLPAVARLLSGGGRVVALVKPQFEAGRAEVPRGGVVRDPSVWRTVLFRLETDAAAAGLGPMKLIRSPIAGGDGNVEFLALLERGAPAADWEARVDAVVAASVPA